MNPESGIGRATVGERIHFQLMAGVFRLRDLLHPPERILLETGMGSGHQVLDYGCGPGSFSMAAARLVGETGQVFAVDISPLAIASVRRSAEKLGLDHVRPVLGSSLDALPEGGIDIVLLYDVLHGITDHATLLHALRKVLKPEGLLSVSDHHLPAGTIIDMVAGASPFRFTGRRHSTLRFEPVSGKGHGG